MSTTSQKEIAVNGNGTTPTTNDSKEKLDYKQQMIDSINWKFLDHESISKWNETVDTLSNKVEMKELQPVEIFYEVMTCLNDFPQRISVNNLLYLTNTIISNIPNVKDRQEASIQFLMIAQACNPKPHTYGFLQSVKIDMQFKRQYLEVREGIFPDFKRCYFNDAKVHDYGIETYSSLHESSEGYSKFTIEVANILTEPHSLYKVDYFIQVIERLIGHFKLDTNRCFVLILNIFGTELLNDSSHEQTILQVLKKSIWWNSKENNNTLQTLVISYLLRHSYTEKPYAELKLIALLIRENLLEFHSIYNALPPHDFEIDSNFGIKSIEENSTEKLYEQFREDETAKSFKATASALALAAPLVLDDDDDNSEEASKPIKMETQKITTEKVPLKLDLKTLIANNHKITCLKYTLQYRMYGESLFILSQFPFLPMIDEDISDLINEFMDEIITPFVESNVELLQLAPSQRLEVNNPSCPKATCFDDLIKYSDELMKFNGYKIANHPILFTKLVRLMDSGLNNDDGSNDLQSKQKWLQFYRMYIFKSLPFVSNMPVVNEAFDVLQKHFPLSTQYNLFGEFQDFLTKNDLDIKLKNNAVEKKTKDILKRLSKENLSTMMRQLAKISYANPLAVTNTFVNHIESYSSLSGLIVESSKFFNKFTWEALTFQLCNKLNSNRLSMQGDGLNHMQWLQNLSSFIGKLSKTHLQNFQLNPLLTCIMKNLSSGSTEMILLIKEIISSMSGIQNINNLTPKQISLLNSEVGLRKLTYMVIQDDRMNSGLSSTRLLECLASLNYLSELFILLCNLPDKIVSTSTDPLKILNLRCDELNSLVHMFTAMIEENMKPEDFTNSMLSASKLIQEFKVKPEWAFEVWRKQWSTQIRSQQIEGIKITALDELIQELPSTISRIDWAYMKPQLYATFWQLSLYDINDQVSYQAELKDIKSQIENINKKLNIARKDPDFSRVEYHRLESNLKLLTSIVKEYKNDELKRAETLKLTSDRLNGEKDTWFETTNDADSIEKSTDQFLEYCILPRVIHSSFDAVFTAKFIFNISKLKTPGFSLLSLLNKLFNCKFLLTTLFTNTGLETENLGLFYSQVLKKLNQWRIDPALYYEEALGLETELTEEDVLLSDGELEEPATKANNAEDNDDDVQKMDIDEESDKAEGKEKEIDANPSEFLFGMRHPGTNEALLFEKFRETLFQWHSSLIGQIATSLDSTHYTTRNNSISFLKNLLGNFPVVEDQSELLTEKLANISSVDQREDIKLASNALFVLVTSKRSQCIPIWKFYKLDPTEKKELILKRKEKVALAKKLEAEKLKKQKEKEEKERLERNAAMTTAALSSTATSTAGAVKPYGLVALQKKSAPLSSSSDSEKDKLVSKTKELTPVARSTTESKIGTTKKLEPKVIPSAPTTREETPVSESKKPVATADVKSSTTKNEDQTKSDEVPLKRSTDTKVSDAHSQLMNRLKEEKRKIAEREREAKGNSDEKRPTDDLIPRVPKSSSLSSSSPAPTPSKVTDSTAALPPLPPPSSLPPVQQPSSSNSSYRRGNNGASSYHVNNINDDRLRDSRDYRNRQDERHSSKNSRDPRNYRDSRDYRDPRDTRDARDIRDTRDARDTRDVRDARNVRDPRDTRDVKDARDVRDNRDTRDTRDSRNSRLTKTSARSVEHGRDYDREREIRQQGRENSERKRAHEGSYGGPGAKRGRY
ncbi:hypothetical protein CANARDRAFT_26595 [[Candida] arabinofermentans NRRL YB-2248]|uniref:THO complex subunit 2 n=1 Tax=[Candida] arabinofermentans NRRL YB-2248 TaxID=983967 RepID=A0A1E4T5Y4_9ASCO|nr:hypothetical protein CANARDRAFT_26595 [[Candida] arabinofermentans NRRL YB-2248]